MSYAFVFPGQGSQSVGMLADMAAYSPLVADTFKQASDVLNYDMWSVVSTGPVETLNQTAVTQPAILTASVALWRVWCSRVSNEQRPALMAGHSLGEYSALVCAGTLDFADALALVAARGAYMQEAVPEGEGAMSVVLGLDDDVIVKVCADAADGDVVEAVNFNAPLQVVIAGQRNAVKRAGAAALEAGARRVQPLPVSVPAHSSLMHSAAEKFAERLMAVDVRKSSCSVYQNVGIDQVDNVRDALVKQLYSPVPWTRIVQTMAARGVTQVMECGPGKVLCGLNRRIDKSLTNFPLHTPEALVSAIDAVDAITVEVEEAI